MHLSVPSICFVCVFVCRKSPHLRVWELDHRCSPYVVSLGDYYVLCILPFGMLCLSAISMMFVKIMLAVCMLVGMVV